MTHKTSIQFDEILGRHIERLLGTQCGIGELNLNLATISCLVLLNERESEIESFSAAASERYTRETLLGELGEIGLHPDEDLENIIQGMAQKNYIDINDAGILIPKKPSTSMVALLELAFPKMPGMNLIAYFAQTMDEVQSGRKDLDTAISQFDQTLQMQGVPLEKQKDRPAKEKASQKVPLKTTGSSSGDDRQITGSKVLKGSVIYKELKPDSKITESYVIPSESKSASSYKGLDWYKDEGVTIKPVFSAEDFSQEVPQESDDEIEPRKADVPQQDEADEQITEKAEAGSSSPEPEPSPETDSEDGPGGLAETTETGPAKDTEIEAAEEEVQSDTPDKYDNTVGKRITEFQEDLALECPMCKKAKVQVKETATGKNYYKCNNKDCNFISWGKPYHISCPVCRNPFLIEASDKHEKKILKCPRATCRYWREYPAAGVLDFQGDSPLSARNETNTEMTPKKPRRRVVRRRVVRRKK